VDLDEEAVARFRLEAMPPQPYPTPGLVLAIRWGSGATTYYAHTRQFWDDFLAGRLPIFSKGVRLEQVMDDGSKEWKDLHAQVQKGAVHA